MRPTPKPLTAVWKGRYSGYAPTMISRIFKLMAVKRLYDRYRARRAPR